jgi:ATP-dependent DNA ligase
MQADILAGPYELTHKKIPGDKMTLCIISGNVVKTRKYEKNRLAGEKKKVCKDFEAAMTTLEALVETFSVDYDVKVDTSYPQNGPVSLPAAPKKLPEPSVLGKRQSSKGEPVGLKRLKSGEGASQKVVADQKK